MKLCCSLVKSYSVMGRAAAPSRRRSPYLPFRLEVSGGGPKSKVWDRRPPKSPESGGRSESLPDVGAQSRPSRPGPALKFASSSCSEPGARIIQVRPLGASVRPKIRAIPAEDLRPAMRERLIELLYGVPGADPETHRMHRPSPDARTSDGANAKRASGPAARTPVTPSRRPTRDNGSVCGACVALPRRACVSHVCKRAFAPLCGSPGSPGSEFTPLAAKKRQDVPLDLLLCMHVRVASCTPVLPAALRWPRGAQRGAPRCARRCAREDQRGAGHARPPTGGFPPRSAPADRSQTPRARRRQGAAPCRSHARKLESSHSCAEPRGAPPLSRCSDGPSKGIYPERVTPGSASPNSTHSLAYRWAGTYTCPTYEPQETIRQRRFYSAL